MRTIRFLSSLCFAVGLSGCGAGGILNLNPKPDGNIVIYDAASGATLNTTFASPFTVGSGGFSIGISENNFSGPYTVTVIAWTAPFSIPCFVPHYVDSTQKSNVVKFTADNAAPVSDPTQASPCNQYYASGGFHYDEETARIADNDGHSVNFYYQLGPASSSSSALPGRRAP